METIFINAGTKPKENGEVKLLHIDAKSKKDFLEQIEKLKEEKEITNNWHLALSSVMHKWFYS